MANTNASLQFAVVSKVIVRVVRKCDTDHPASTTIIAGLVTRGVAKLSELKRY